MPKPPTLCMVHNNVDNDSSIGRIAKWAVEQALGDNWRVTVVAHDLDPALRPHVEWLRLFVPPRVHLVQWLAARPTIQRAIGGRAFDVVHVHQSQVAGISDIMQCHYMMRSAYERNALTPPTSPKRAAFRLEQLAILRAEDRYLRRSRDRTTFLFDSELMRTDFERLYGRPRRAEVLLYPAPPLTKWGHAHRAAARTRWLPERIGSRVVIGYLGGLDFRKGFDRAVAAVADLSGAFLLGAGPGSEGAWFGELGDAQRWCGQVSEVGDFLAAVDVLLVPSRFDPFGLVCLEAAAAQVPVIATDEVGALPTLIAFAAGVRWNPADSLGPPMETVRARLADLQAGCRNLVDTFSEAEQGKRLLRAYAAVRRRDVNA